MPIKGKSPKETVHTEMHKFKHGSLHSGSKHGPLVVNRKQAIAIALSEARRAGKKAGGGKVKARQPSENVDDRREEQNNRFNDSLYFPPGRSTNQEVYDIGNTGRQPNAYPDISPDQYTHLGDDLGKSQLDLKAMGFADGGDVADDSWKDKEAQEGLALQQAQQPQPAPQHDFGKGLSRWWYGDQPTPAYGPKPEGELPEADMTQDPISRMLAAPFNMMKTAGKAYQEGLTPDEQTEFGVNTAMMNMIHPPVEGGLATGMGNLKYTKGVTPETLPDLHDTVMNGAAHNSDEHPYANAIGKDLKAIFPKDIATSAFYLGLGKEDVANLKSHMSEGAQGAFDKHYDKLMETAQKKAGNTPPTPEQELFPDFKMPEEDETAKALKAIEEALKNPESLEEPSATPKKEYNDKDIEDYFKEQDEQATKEDTPIPPKPTVELAEKHLKPLDWQNYNPDLPEPARTKARDLSNKLAHVKELGFNPNIPIYKGGAHTIPEELLDPSTKHYEQAFFAAHDPYVAKQYGPLTEPYIARAPKAFEVNWPDVAGHEVYDGPPMNAIIEAARKHGADLVAIHNIHDMGGPQTQYAFLNTHVLRQPHAKFDPTKLHLRYPLAGLAGGGLFAYGMAGNQSNQGQMKRGGKVKHKQIDEDPKPHEFIDFSRGGMLDSHIPGRTDKIPLKTRPGSYVLPADIPSALGEGNSQAGAEILKKMFTHSAYGLPPPHINGRAFQYPHHLNLGSHHHARGGKVEAEKALPADHQLGMKVPKGGSMCANCKFLATPTTCGNNGFVEWNHGAKLPAPADEYCCDLYGHKVQKKADGGSADDPSDHAHIIAAGGEFIIPKEIVEAVGNGDIKAGHRLLDKFVLHTRKEHIKTLKGLKPPK